ncbi:MAG: SCP2 sterol-binding domain-containing protein [Thermoplasmata archaeon]
MQDLLDDLIMTFNERAQTDPRLQEEIAGMERTIQVVTDKSAYHMALGDGQIGGLEEGRLEDADVTITCDEDTFRGLVEGTVPPFKAMATGKLKLNASLEDALRLRKLLSARR